MGVGATALVAYHRERGGRVNLASVTRESLVLPGLASSLVALLVMAGAWLLAPLVLAQSRPWLIVLAAISIPFAALQLPLQHVLQGFEDVVGQNVIYVAYGAIFSAAAVAGAYFGHVYGAVAGLAIGNIALAVMYLLRTRSLLDRAQAPLRSARRGAGSLGTLLRVGAASLAITLVYGVADLGIRTTLLHTHGSRVAGYWFALLTISLQFIGMLAGAVSYFTAPLAARTLGSGDPNETRRLLDNSLRLVIVVVMPTLALLIATRQMIIGLLFSHAFDPISRTMPIQLAGDAARTVGWALGVALVPLGLTRAWLGIGIGTSVVFGVLGSFFAERWGLTGAAAAWAITWGLAAIATAILLLRAGYWRPSPEASGGIVVTAAALGLATYLPGMGGVAVVVIASGLLIFVLARPTERTRALQALRLLRAP